MKNSSPNLRGFYEKKIRKKEKRRDEKNEDKEERDFSTRKRRELA